MPFYKRRYKPYRGYRKRYIKRSRKKSTLTSKVNYLMKQNRINRPQFDFSDTTAAAADIYDTATVVAITAAGSGDHRCTIRSVQLVGKVKKVSDAASAVNYRVVIFTDKSNEGSTPTWTDLYSTETVFSLRRIAEDENEGQRFRVLYDKKFWLVKDADGTTRDTRILKFYKKLNIPSIWDTSNSRWEKGGLYLAFIAEGATGGSDFLYNIRVRSVPRSNSD